MIIQDTIPAHKTNATAPSKAVKRQAPDDVVVTGYELMGPPIRRLRAVLWNACHKRRFIRPYRQNVFPVEVLQFPSFVWRTITPQIRPNTNFHVAKLCRDDTCDVMYLTANHAAERLPAP
jgi:hypothetical protein